MPDLRANSDTFYQPALPADPPDEGAWQPDLDPDLSAEVSQEREDYPTFTAASAPQWQSATSEGSDSAESVAVEDYHTDPERALIMQVEPNPAELEEHVGTPFIPPATAGREIPNWLWLAIAAFLILAIIIFHQAGIYIFFIGIVLIIGIFRATEQSLARSPSVQQSYGHYIDYEPGQGWHPDYDPDFGTPASQSPSSPLQPLAPGKPVAPPQHEPATPLPQNSLQSSYQPGQPQQYAWVKPSRSRRGRTERQEVQRWAALIGVTFGASLMIFSNTGGWVCLTIWLVVGIWHRFSTGEPARILGVRPTPYVVMMVALLGYIFYLLLDNGMLLNLEAVIMFAVLCVLSWMHFRNT